MYTSCVSTRTSGRSAHLRRDPRWCPSRLLSTEGLLAVCLVHGHARPSGTFGLACPVARDRDKRPPCLALPARSQPQGWQGCRRAALSHRTPQIGWPPPPVAATLAKTPRTANLSDRPENRGTAGTGAQPQGPQGERETQKRDRKGTRAGHEGDRGTQGVGGTISVAFCRD